MPALWWLTHRAPAESWTASLAAQRVTGWPAVGAGIWHGPAGGSGASEQAPQAQHGGRGCDHRAYRICVCGGGGGIAGGRKEAQPGFDWLSLPAQAPRSLLGDSQI